MNYAAASSGVAKIELIPKIVTPECFYRGSSPNIPPLDSR